MDGFTSLLWDMNCFRHFQRKECIHTNFKEVFVIFDTMLVCMGEAAIPPCSLIQQFTCNVHGLLVFLV